MMIKYFLYLALIAGLFFSTGCDDDDEDLLGDWVECSDLDGISRAYSSVFVIDDIAYLVGGYSDDEDEYLNELWSYDPVHNQWEELTPCPGVGRCDGVAFAVNNKGYYGTGFDGDNKLKDFWCYDPSTNTWDSVADFAGSARRSAVAFGLNNKGYVGTGYDDNNLKDFYSYDPTTNSWTQINSIGGSKRRYATAFVIGDYAYVGTGVDNSSFETDFWRFDPSQDYPWEEMNELDDDDYGNDDIPRSNACSFVINGIGYIATGYRSGATSDVWAYTPSTDSWEEVTSLEGANRQAAVGFGIGNYGYITTGLNGSSYYDNIWQFDPTAEYDDEN